MKSYWFVRTGIRTKKVEVWDLCFEEEKKKHEKL